MLSLILVLVLFVGLALHGGALRLATPDTMSAEWVAELRASRGV